MYKCLIFDLDNTIVDTSFLDEWRKAGKWGAVLKNIQQTKPHPGFYEIVNCCADLGVRTAILSNSPRNYVEKVLKLHNISVDFVLGYHDVPQPKPSPSGLEMICQHFQFSSEECLFVGDSETDFLAAKEAGISYYNVPWGEHLPSAKVYDFFQISKEILRVIADNEGRATELLKLNNHYFLAYYNSSGDEIKYQTLDFKKCIAPTVERWSSCTEHIAQQLPQCDVIVRALNSNELHADITSPLNDICKSIERTSDAVYLPQLLKKTRNTDKSINMSRRERLEKVRGIYQFSPSRELESFSRPRILIVDDVFTSGATTSEITRAIHEVLPQAIITIFTLTKAASLMNDAMRQHNVDFSLWILTVSKSIETHNKVAKPSLRTPAPNHWVKNSNYTANYAYSNNNFVIQNLPNTSALADEHLRKFVPGISIAHNIIQRGTPTIMSRLLRQRLNVEQIPEASLPLFSEHELVWNRTIRGGEEQNQQPAQFFYDTLIQKYLGEYGFIKNLIIPELRISEITNVYTEHLLNKQVDFYLPQALLIIEIDGKQHSQQTKIDQARDHHTRKFGIETIRFTTEEIWSENDSFKRKISNLLNRLIESSKVNNARKELGEKVFSLDDYRKALKRNSTEDRVALIATAIARHQVLVLELLASGRLSFDKDWQFYIKDKECTKSFELAISDLINLLKVIYQLQGIDFPYISYEVNYLDEVSTFPSDRSAICVDFSLFHRFTDEFQTSPNTLFVRTHYLDEYLKFSDSSVSEMSAYQYEHYDFFSMRTSETINYDLDYLSKQDQRDALKYLLENIFLPYLDDVDFREGQFGIISNSLARRDTIGLLPTGSGKSICFQLAAILQPAISFVVCPIKSLMYDQKEDLDTVGFTRTNFITGELTASEKVKIQKDFGNGKYFFVYISPERFQTQAFRDQLSTIAIEKALAYAVIDEVHCLSEWGHDFRTSYLNLANTIDNFAKGTTYIGLTATASINVLKDIQSEFHVIDEDVKAPLDFSRGELYFDVVDGDVNKSETLSETARELREKWHAQDNNQHFAGIIFTQNVNGVKGCYQISKQLQMELATEVGFFSGKKPDDLPLHEMSGIIDFDAFKKKRQEDFKRDKYELLVATKAFGMGVNKGNVAYTIHYGIPSSMEALYQEGGRAGRNKKLFETEQADCFVVLTREPNVDEVERLWDRNTSIPELQDIVKNNLDRSSDLNTNMFLIVADMKTINDELQLLKKLIDVLVAKNSFEVTLHKTELNESKQAVEKGIYRLSQMGIVRDWVIEDFFAGIFLVYLNKFDDKSVSTAIETTVSKYESGFSLDDFFVAPDGYYEILVNRYYSGKATKLETYIGIFLLWSYDHFVYNRRQSLKNVYEQCSMLADRQITPEQFKVNLENYFKFNEGSDALFNIANHPGDISLWLLPFYDPEQLDKKVIASEKYIYQVRAQLSRFLESYKDNPGLNFVSGILRLMANDFDNADGRQRLEHSFKFLKSFASKEVNSFVQALSELKTVLDIYQRDRLTPVLLSFFSEHIAIDEMYRLFEDNHSLSLALQNRVNAIQNINNRLRGQGWLIH